MKLCKLNMCFGLALMYVSLVGSLHAEGYPVCGTPLLVNETQFSVYETYRSSDVEMQIGPIVRLGVACGLSDSGGATNYYTSFNDWGAAIYSADTNRANVNSMFAQFAISRMCGDPKDGHVVSASIGYFDSIPHPDSVTRERIDYLVSDGMIEGHVNSKENLEGTLVVRDKESKVVATAIREGTEWKVDNPKKLSPVHIAFILTHKLNKDLHCWGTNAPVTSGDSGIGFWPSIAIAVGLTAAITGGIFLAINCFCKVCVKNRSRYQAVSAQDQELEEVL